MINPDGSPNTARQPVPIILVDKEIRTIHDGVLRYCTNHLGINGSTKPEVMTCHSLLNKINLAKLKAI
jgi:2,3-bisphosphoglycerate-independent phosphoglycerate mutase